MYCCITIDADWAHPRIAAYILDKLERTRTRFTYFATENQIAPQSPLCELAWHPNFERGPGVAELDQLANLFPGARGLRPHRLNWGDCDDATLRHYGIEWVSSVYLKDSWQPVARPGLVEVPIAWGDNWWFLKNLAPDWEAMRGEAPGIYVINFHPFHVFLNTVSLEQYEQAKTCYQEPEVLLRDFRSPRTDGVESVFEAVLDAAQRSPERFLCISEALARHQEDMGCKE